MDDKTQSLNKKNDDDGDEVKQQLDPKSPATAGYWGGWGLSPLSFLTDLQKAATVAAEEISRNAAAVAETASKSIAELKINAEDSESSKEDNGGEGSPAEKENGDEDDKRRKAALERLEKASDDSILSQASIGD
ncbi:hypothetical protein TanjilG_15244 [Lupinus angustifolius]|uniref:Uncharacterized protein n=1 Tax=Lupinus angustifolius TaxID=3871 RepID=A0A1J7GN25_LUPAN|nr:hypothetical protein TanjilG_15244 [Lupinus angustifolius]